MLNGKKMLTSSEVLAHFDPNLPIVLPSEANYSQIEKQGLACIFGVKKFHAYLYGHHFTLAQTIHL